MTECRDCGHPEVAHPNGWCASEGCPCDKYVVMFNERIARSAAQAAAMFNISVEMATTAINGLMSAIRMSAIRASRDAEQVRNIITSQRVRRHK